MDRHTAVSKSLATVSRRVKGRKGSFKKIMLNNPDWCDPVD